MKYTKTKLLIAAAAVASIAYGCAASDYSSPSDVTKTGSGSSSFEFDFSKAPGYAPMLAAAATTAAVGTQTAVKFAVDSYSTTTGIRPAIFAIGTTYPFAQAQAGYLKNPNYSGTSAGLGTPKSISATLKWTTGTTNLTGNQSVQFTLAFSSDLNKDGTSDSVAYIVRFTATNGAGSVLFIRSTSISSAVDTTDGTCVIAGNVGNLTPASTAHTGVITITPATTTGMPVTITATVDGGTTATYTETTGGTNMSTCAGAGADATSITSFTVGGSAATMGALMFGGLFPVWSVQVGAQTGNNATPIADTGSSIINSVTYQ